MKTIEVFVVVDTKDSWVEGVFGTYEEAKAAAEMDCEISRCLVSLPQEIQVQRDY